MCMIQPSPAQYSGRISTRFYLSDLLTRGAPPTGDISVCRTRTPVAGTGGISQSSYQCFRLSCRDILLSCYPAAKAKLSRSPHIWRPPQYERSGGSTRVKVRGQISNSRRIFRLGPLPQHFTLNLESAFSLQIIFKHGWKCAKMQIL